MTTALGGNTYDARRHVGRRGASHRRAFSVGLGMVGLTTVVISAWGANHPLRRTDVRVQRRRFVGLGVELDPFRVGTSTRGNRGVGRVVLFRTGSNLDCRSAVEFGCCGVIAVACGAWFVIGPWPGR